MSRDTLLTLSLSMYFASTFPKLLMVSHVLNLASGSILDFILPRLDRLLAHPRTSRKATVRGPATTRIGIPITPHQSLTPFVPMRGLSMLNNSREET